MHLLVVFAMGKLKTLVFVLVINISVEVLVDEVVNVERVGSDGLLLAQFQIHVFRLRVEEGANRLDLQLVNGLGRLPFELLQLLLVQTIVVFMEVLSSRVFHIIVISNRRVIDDFLSLFNLFQGILELKHAFPSEWV